MFTDFIEVIRPIVETYGAWGVFAISVAEEIIAPIPSTLTILAAGFFLVPAGATLLEGMIATVLMVALPSAFGITIGSSMLFGVVWWGGKPLIDRFGRYTGIGWKDIQKIQNHFEKGYADEIILLVLRSTPLIPNSAISAFCGLIRYPFKPFFIITLIGTFIRALIMGTVGWRVGEAYLEYAHSFEEVEKYVWLVIILIALAVAVHLWRNRKTKNQNESVSTVN